jgi:hypothetical protein
MELIEQVAFTGAETENSDGPWRVAASPGVCEADLAQILAWGPTQETLLANGPETAGLHFHRLPSGAFAIGRTVVSGRGAGLHGGLQAATQCLVVPCRTLARFANNPFALLRVVQAGGLFRPFEDLPVRLDALRLDGRTTVVDTGLLRQLCVYPGADWMATLVQAALDSASTAIVGGPQAEHLIAGVMNCFPPECRAEIGFSIGLRFSSRRPFRLVAMARDPAEQQRMARLYNLAVLDLSGRPPSEFAPEGSWSRLIHRVLKSGRISFFAGQLARRPLDFSPQDLPALGLQMLEELDASACEEETPEAPMPAEGEPCEDRGECQSPASEAEDRFHPPAEEPGDDLFASGTGMRQPHQRHRGVFPNAALPAAPAVRPSPPSRQLDASDPAVLEKLERLDDLVFDAISGNCSSLEELKLFWPRVRHDLGDPLLAESREQYLRYALASWEELADRDGIRDPSFAMQSLEVLCVLFGGA